MFVGAERIAEVQGLIETFERVRHDAEPRMVVYVAPPGWGKTRLIQEFYARLASRQPAPPYWPSSLLPMSHEGKSNVLQLGYERKSVRHRELLVPEGATIPWLWLAPASGRLSDGSPAPVLDSVTRQITEHLPHLLKRIGEQGVSAESLYQAIGSALTLPDLLEVADAIDDMSDELLGGWQAWRAVWRARRGQQGDDVGRANALSRLLATLLQAFPEPLAVVVVLDDAHDLDETATAFAAELLSTQLPILMIATAWPDRLAESDSPEPFPTLLSDAKGSGRVMRIDLQELNPNDLIDYVLACFPGTDPRIAAKLAERADRNPYALRLLLNLPRIASSVQDGRITLAPEDIGQVRSGLVDLLGEHWTRLPYGVQQILVAASLLGECTLDEVLQAGLAQMSVSAGMAEAYASAWIRPMSATSRIVEFVERLRYEIVLDRASSVMAEEIQDAVLSGALRSVRRHLHSDLEPFSRRVLLALHVTLGRAGIEADTALAAASAMELAQLSRREHRRTDAISYLRDAVVWLNAAGDGVWQELVQCKVGLSEALRIEYRREIGEPIAIQALDVADSHLAADDEWRIRARLELARCRWRRPSNDAYGSKEALVAEAEQMASLLPTPSPELTHSLRSIQASMIGSRGDRVRADKLFSELVEFCEQSLGLLHPLTLDALGSWGFQAHRTGDGERAISIRRTLLHRRIELAGVVGSLQTAPARNDLAFSLLEYGGEAGLVEADRLVSEAISIWARTYGEEGSRTLRARLQRSRVRCRQGLVAESAGDSTAAQALFDEGRQEAAAVVALRRAKPPARPAKALLRLGFALACLRDPEAIPVLHEALSIREDTLLQAVDSWEVRSCARMLVWAHSRLGHVVEAGIVRRRYGLSDEDGIRIS